MEDSTFGAQQTWKLSSSDAAKARTLSSAKDHYGTGMCSFCGVFTSLCSFFRCSNCFNFTLALSYCRPDYPSGLETLHLLHVTSHNTVYGITLSLLSNIAFCATEVVLLIAVEKESFTFVYALVY